MLLDVTVVQNKWMMFGRQQCCLIIIIHHTSVKSVWNELRKNMLLQHYIKSICLFNVSNVKLFGTPYAVHQSFDKVANNLSPSVV